MTTSKISHIQPIVLNERLKKGEDICLIDVREEWEHSLASIKGSNHIPLNELVDRVQEIMFEDEIETISKNIDSISFLGITLSKSGYNSLVWIIIFALIGGLATFVVFAFSIMFS